MDSADAVSQLGSDGHSHNRAGSSFSSKSSSVSALKSTSRSTSEVGSGSHAESSSNGIEEQIEDSKRLKGAKFAVLLLCVLFGDFFVGYDTSCVATLTPVITNQFNTLSDVGWYGTAYLLASCATVLIYGQLYSFYPMKQIYMTSFLIFVIGSTVSATANSSPIFIVGRALSGLGSAGIFAGGSIIVANTTSLEHRPIYQAMSGGMECVSLALGPLISGVIAHYASWRVSFYIVIPAGVAVTVTVLLLIHSLQRPENAHLSDKEKLRRLDLIGFTIYVPMITCLILGLQWAGIEYPWQNWRVVLLMILAGVLLLVFLAVEHRQDHDSMFPLDLLRLRSVALASAFTFCNSAALFIIAYYLPIYFQVIRNADTLGSGLMYLPTAVSFGLAVLVAGPATSLVGYYNPIMITGSILMTVATGLITTFDAFTSPVKWISYQILYGIGVGLAFQQPYTAVQTVLPESKVPTALVTLSFTQEIGGIVALSVAQNVLVNRLAHNLGTQIPGLDPKIILNNGALDIIDAVPKQFRDQLLKAYSGAIIDVFYIALALTCLTVFCAVAMEWKSVKDEKKGDITIEG